MISKLKEQYYLLKFFKKIKNKTRNIEQNIFNKLLKTIFIPSMIIPYTCFFYFYDLNNYSSLTLAGTLLITIPFVTLIFYSFLYIFISILNAIFNSKLKYIFKYSPELISRIRPLSGGYFCKKKYTIRINEKISKINTNLLDIVLEENIDSNNLLFKASIKTILKDTNKEDIINNLNLIVNDFNNSKLYEYNDIFYDILLNYLFNNLDYVSFNKYKVLIVNIIEENFNEFEQQKYFKELNNLKLKLDNSIVRNNINKYKQQILNNKSENLKNIVLKNL